MSEPFDIVKKSLIRKSYQDIDASVYGKLPPQARELEEAVLGAVLLEKSAIYEVSDTLSNDCFYVEANSIIWQAILTMNSEMRAIDPLTVSEQLKKDGKLDHVGGQYYIHSLTNKIGSSANIREHALVIYQKYLQRRLIQAAFDIIKQAYDDSTDAFELLSKSQNAIDDIGNSISNSESFYDSVCNRSHDLSDAKKNFTKTGLMTNLWKFDNHVGGFQNGELIIIAGRPSMGKSAVMVDFAYHQAKDKIPVGVFTLEMTKQQLIDRFFSIDTDVEYEKMRTGGLRDEEMKKINNQTLSLAELPLYIQDEGGIGISKLMSVCKSWKHKYGIRAIYIDYIQLVSAFDSGIKFGNREQELSYISRKLKTLAKNLQIPVIALSQLSRSVEARSDKRPMLSDLRESGAIEQDADMVIFPFRPSYYQMKDENGSIYSDTYCELIIGKFRNGKTKDLIVEFYPQYSRFNRRPEDPFGGAYTKQPYGT